MALIAETLVEEWLNRSRYFTIRGIRKGNEEIDLLAVRSENGHTDALHVEVQVSFDPVGYITRLTTLLAKELGVARKSAKRRTQEMVTECVRSFIDDKFDASIKVQIRDEVWPGLKWRRVFVYGTMRPDELQALKVEKERLTLIPLQKVLHDLCDRERNAFTTSAAGDLARLIEFYKNRNDEG